MRPSPTVSVFLLALTLGLSAAPANAQKLGKNYRKFPALGVEFKPLKDFSDVPVDARVGERSGLVAQMDSRLGPYVKFKNGDGHEWNPSLRVLYIEVEGPTTDGGRERKDVKEIPRTAADYVMAVYAGAVNKKNLKGETSELKASKEYVAERVEFVTDFGTNFGKLELVLDVYTYQHGLGKMVFIWDYPATKKVRKKWGNVIEKSMRSFRASKKGAVESDLGAVDSDSSYEDLLKFHQDDVSQTPGWQVVETKTKQYLIKTNSDDKADIQEVIRRLEASRKLYEVDFPPSSPITSVSVVRLCAKRTEFNTYGRTGGGVAGYFNPASEELVLFFGEDGKALTLSVMAHEGFHQYCHFLFGRAEAHRWFDEGHGDFYGAWKMKGKKLIQEEDMKGGLARVPELKEMFRNGKIKPLSEHIRYSHGEWQTQGPSNVSCYAQSFGLIYFLRQGAKRKIKSKYWEKEYATIIPNYMRVLNEGFSAAHDEIRKAAQEKLDELTELHPDEVDLSLKEILEDRIKKPWNFVHADKEEIWENAMKASWGQIDEDKFEENWLSWVEKDL